MSKLKIVPLVAVFVAIVLFGAAPRAASAAQEHAVLAGGCFWGMEAVFESLKGVTNVVSGFAGGSRDTAHYEMVSTGTTGHAEAVDITYDPAQISYSQLLDVYFSVAHDPTELNRQGPDSGTQYRSAIFFANDAQKQTALRTISRLKSEKKFDAPIVTQVTPLRGFYAAEAYHQHYLKLHPYEPYIVYNDMPKLAALHKTFPSLVKGR